MHASCLCDTPPSPPPRRQLRLQSFPPKVTHHDGSGGRRVVQYGLMNASHLCNTSRPPLPRCQLRLQSCPQKMTHHDGSKGCRVVQYGLMNECNACISFLRHLFPPSPCRPDDSWDCRVFHKKWFTLLAAEIAELSTKMIYLNGSRDCRVVHQDDAIH